MLSPGKWYQFIPKEPRQNLKFRIALLQRAALDKNLQRGLVEMCKQDVLFFINIFVWQYNPKKFGNEEGPFITWPFQDDELIGGTDKDGKHLWGVLECIEDQEDARWPKSREMGASWIVLIAILWLALFHSRKKALVISRDEDAVDRPDDPDCLFWKISYILEHLPDWMSRGAYKRKMGFTFPATRSTVNGEANTVKAGVGGRASIALFDEFGQFKDGKEIYSRTADTADCRVFVYTHKDKTSMAYELSYDEKYSGMRQILTHWTQHPDKNKGLYRYNAETNRIDYLNPDDPPPHDHHFVYEEKPTGGAFPGIRSPWYDKQCIRRPRRAVAMDLDIDPQGASDQFFDHGTIIQLQQKFCRSPIWLGELRYDRDTARPIELFENGRGPLKLWVLPKSKEEMPPSKFVCGWDLGWGSGATPSCGSFVNEVGEKVAEYMSAMIAPNDLAPLAIALCRFFKDRTGRGAKMAWEIQGPGISFGNAVIRLSYMNVYIHSGENKFGVTLNADRRPGWPVTSGNKMSLLNNYADDLRHREFLNPSRDALQQCLSFMLTPTSVEYKGKRKADDDDGTDAGVHHGDMVIADALANMLRREIAVVREVLQQKKQPDPRSLEGRMALWLRQQEEERELEWV